MATLPRPEVSVSTTAPCPETGVGGGTAVTILRDGKGRTYTSDRGSEMDRTKEIVEKVIGDGGTAEWLP